MAKLEGTSELVRKVNALLTKVEPKTAIVVGYTQTYAIYVHENLEAHHPVGQAKYLEQPLRQMSPVIGSTVEALVRRKVKLNKALLMIGLLLQRESQKLVPVDTGALKGSAFTREEKL